MTATMSSITADVSVRQSDVRLDLADVLELLAAAVDQRGGAFVLVPLSGDGEPHRIHRYARAGKPRSVIGHALALAGVTGEDLNSMRNESLRDLYRDGRLPIEITLGALIVLDTAQRSEARGHCWGDVLDDAVSAMAKFLDLVPELLHVTQSLANCRHSCRDRHPSGQDAALPDHSGGRRDEAPDLTMTSPNRVNNRVAESSLAERSHTDANSRT